MCKWRIYGPDDFSVLAVSLNAYPDLNVVDGVWDDGYTSCLSDPDDPNDDWDQFSEQSARVSTLISDTIPNHAADTQDGTLDGSWAAAYAWDLNGGS